MVGDLSCNYLPNSEAQSHPTHGTTLSAARLGEPLAPRDLLGRLRALGI